jgi:hypothetical protein
LCCNRRVDLAGELFGERFVLGEAADRVGAAMSGIASEETRTRRLCRPISRGRPVS